MCAGDFVNFALYVGFADATCVSISIPTLNRGFIKDKGETREVRIAMANLKRTVVSVLIILALLSVLMVLGQATIATLIVKGGEEVTHPIGLIAEDRVLIQYKVIGGNPSALHFNISLPNGTVKDFGKSSDFSYSFVCDVEGEYVLHFVNTDQTEEVRVTLDYEIDHYIFGMPQMLFMVILIAVVSVAGVAVFIGLSRKP